MSTAPTNLPFPEQETEPVTLSEEPIIDRSATSESDPKAPLGCCSSSSRFHTRHSDGRVSGKPSSEAAHSGLASFDKGTPPKDPSADSTSVVSVCEKLPESTQTQRFSGREAESDSVAPETGCPADDAPRRKGWWWRIRQALDLNGCSTCHSASSSPDAPSGCGCARGPLCKAMADGPSAGHGNEGGGRFRRRRRGNGRPAAVSHPSGRLTLAHMKPGSTGSIREVNGVGVLRRRLLEMGVLPGTPFKVERVAPLGDPIEIRVRGYALSLRRNEAAHILVESAN